MKNDAWNPQQYNLFKEQRAKPFWDLVDLVQPAEFARVVDLGCGTGELTRQLHQKTGAKITIGVDSSDAMLTQAKKFESEELRFEMADIASFVPSGTFDLVFSNAALQWVPGHESLIPKILGWVALGGQVAIQMPANFDHPSHKIAYEVASDLFADRFRDSETRRFVLPVEKYSELFYRSGFHEQRCRLEVYPHPLKKGEDVIEWTKGTLLTTFESRLPKEEFARFLKEYRDRLLGVIGEGPYLYTFKRILLWGRRG